MRPLLIAPALLLAAYSAACAQDIAAGERVFARCRACHQVGENARNGVGPQLNGLFGREAGSVAGYNFSPANKSANFTWTEQNFPAYINDPKAAMPGNKMIFPGVKNEIEVANLITYLKQFLADGKKL
jgi:cytochrome c